MSMLDVLVCPLSKSPLRWASYRQNHALCTPTYCIECLACSSSCNAYGMTGDDALKHQVIFTVCMAHLLASLQMGCPDV